MPDWGNSKCVTKLTQRPIICLEIDFSNSDVAMSKMSLRQKLKIWSITFSLESWYVIMSWLYFISLTYFFIQLISNTIESSFYHLSHLCIICNLFPELPFSSILVIFHSFLPDSTLSIHLQPKSKYKGTPYI